MQAKRPSIFFINGWKKKNNFSLEYSKVVDVTIQRLWLCYSPSSQKSYCEVCWLFSNRNNRSNHELSEIQLFISWGQKFGKPRWSGGPQTQICSKGPRDLRSATGVYPSISDAGLEYELAPYFGGFLHLRRDTKEYKNKVSETGARICLVSDLYNQIPKLCWIFKWSRLVYYTAQQ